MKEIDISALTRYNVQSLTPYSSARDEFSGKEGVFLDANENPFPSAVNRYPDPQQRELKSKFADLRGVHSDQLIIGNGSDEILDLVFRAFCEPGKDFVVTIKPSYGMYKVLANINDVRLTEIALDANFELDPDAILAVAEGAKMIILCSPNNPTGNSLSRKKIIKILEGFNGIVLVDEAYIDFATNPSLVSELKNFQNLMISQTFSKAFGMAGIRVGIGIAHPEIIEVLNRIKPPYNVNAISQEMALNRLAQVDEVASEVTQLKLERSRLINFLEHHKSVSRIYPTDANFILFKVNDANFFYDELVKQGVIIRNRTTAFGCENCLRLSVGTKEENNRFMKVFDNI
tara:strand:- start:144005 stop:145039 length:1035 start_codon:yes stop_codon:yes gene_type:complete